MRALTCFMRTILGPSALLAILLGSSSCGDEYTYFTLSLNIQSSGANAVSLTDRKLIDHCMLNISNEAGEPVEGFTLKSGVLSDGTHFGCSFDETRSFIGLLNYSTLRKSGNLTFEFIAGSGEGGQFNAIAVGSATGSVTPGKSVAVEINATKK